MLLHVFLYQWLVTERAKTQWKKYKAMLDDTQQERVYNAPEHPKADVSGILLLQFTVNF